MSDEKVMVRSCDPNRSDADSLILQPNFLENMKYAKKTKLYVVLFCEKSEKPQGKTS